MSVFEITTIPTDNYRVRDTIGETFDLLGAREIRADHWLLAGSAAEVHAKFVRTKNQLPQDVLHMRELCKADLVESGRLSEEDITFFRSQAIE